MNASSPSLLKIPHFLSKDSQDFSHLFSRPCKTTLSNMEIWVRRERTPGSNHNPRVMAKSKSKKGSDRSQYSQAPHSYAETEDYNNPQYSQEHTREGKSSKTRHHSSYQNWNQRNEGDYHHQSRPAPRWTNKITDDWQPPTPSRQPPQKGKGSHSDNPGTKGKVQQRPSEIELTAPFSFVKTAWL